MTPDYDATIVVLACLVIFLIAALAYILWEV
jgi:hypothetical protein